VPRPHILIVGGTGTFGSRLARLLARRKAYRLTIAARDASRAGALLAELHSIDPYCAAAFMPVERAKIDAELLREVGPAVVVDCSGPFQDTNTSLIEAAIEAKCHYVDLADSRAFVAGIDRFGLKARAAGITVIAGASTTPALTHAVLDSVTKGWIGLDAIDVAIVPGNKTPRGRSVIAGILSWVGQPSKVFEEADWRERRGWSRTEIVTIEDLGRRRAGLAELPDADLLGSRYRPRIRATIRAGLELRVLHGLVGLAGLLVRMRIIRSARALTGVGTFIAAMLAPFGSNAGGMVIEATGRDARGDARVARWSLVARKGEGPYVPVVPAAAIIAGLTSGDPAVAAPGARSAAGVVSLEQIRPWFDGLAIETKLSGYRNEKPLFRIVLGAAYEKIPHATRRLHRGRPAVIADGEARVSSASPHRRRPRRCGSSSNPSKAASDGRGSSEEHPCAR
jgi:NAD(P)-dependent dehydrogenase (short-subunit alcohol dehydrogenase family)